VTTRALPPPGCRFPERDASRWPVVLARYQIVRGKRPEGNPLPEGVRVDIRKHTKHFLRPTRQRRGVPERPGRRAFRQFSARYDPTCRPVSPKNGARSTPCGTGRKRRRLPRMHCPTRTNPEVTRCHTVLALGFMKRKYPRLPIRCRVKRDAISVARARRADARARRIDCLCPLNSELG